MNWITRKPSKVVTALMDHCDHLKTGDTAHCVTSEHDSFGIVGSWADCKVCSEAADAQHANVLTYCHDCNQQFPASEMTVWTPYDYYPPQGDIATEICATCVKDERHSQRVERDRANYQSEFDD